MEEKSFKKEYVSVLISVSPEGDKKPIKITLPDGRSYTVDKVGVPKRRAASKVGGTGIRYPISVGGIGTYLFEDEGKWFVEAKETR